MNKENFSWIHYAYITITASVLAYVTYADNGTEESTSALDMLPNNTLLNESQNSPVDIPVATEVTETSPYPEVATAPEIEVATAPETEVVTTPEAEVATAPEAEVVTAPEVEVATESKTNNVNGGKLKNTRTNNKKHKKKQTRSRR